MASYRKQCDEWNSLRVLNPFSDNESETTSFHSAGTGEPVDSQFIGLPGAHERQLSPLVIESRVKELHMGEVIN